MIKYRLKCNNCNKSFDSWFSSSLEFEKLKSKNFLDCHFCDSKNIKKTLMAPNILNLKQKKENKFKNKKNQEIQKKILEFQNFIRDNFENVGDDFAYKARSLHYNRKKNTKGIYGNATKKQLSELRDEGIETQIFPWIENKKN
tara:strand:+ start:524 stop:952 length:429 start_codon:yes stop_codon:yes gene_type:complete